MALGYQNPFYLKQAQQKQQSLYNGKDLLEKHDPPVVCDSEETLKLAQEKAAKFVRDFKSLAKEADDSLAKHNALELEIEHLLRAVENHLLSLDQNSILSLLFQGLPKIDESHALSKLVTSNSVPTPQEPKIMKNEKVIAPGMFRINPFKTSREEKSMPNKPINASVKTNPITVSQPHVITKKDANSDLNGLSSTGVNINTKTRLPQPRSNTKNVRVPSASKSSCIKNK
ncbi:hypothetical protein Tco_0103845 [Tanacetum coccineum]